MRSAPTVGAAAASDTPNSRASRRTDGEATGVVVFAVAGAVAFALADAVALAVAFAGEAPVGDSPASSRYPITRPTATTAPAAGASGASWRTPLSTASISWTAFSPSSSNSGSPARMNSPSRRFQPANVPSSIDQPSRGIVTLCAMVWPFQNAADHSANRSRNACSIAVELGTTAASRGGL